MLDRKASFFIKRGGCFSIKRGDAKFVGNRGCFSAVNLLADDKAEDKLISGLSRRDDFSGTRGENIILDVQSRY